MEHQQIQQNHTYHTMALITDNLKRHTIETYLPPTKQSALINKSYN